MKIVTASLKSSLFLTSVLLSLGSSAFGQDYPYIAGGTAQTHCGEVSYVGSFADGCQNPIVVGSSTPIFASSFPSTVEVIPECTDENVDLLLAYSLELTTKSGESVLALNPSRHAPIEDRRKLSLLLDNCANGVKIHYVSAVKANATSVTFNANYETLTISQEELAKSPRLINALERALKNPSVVSPL